MPTVTDLKTLFLAQIAPGNPTEFLRLLTESDMRLLEAGRWRWCRNVVILTPVDGIVTLPEGYSSILGARVDKIAVDIRSQEFEFVPGGAGEVELGVGNSRLLDQGLNASYEREYKVSGHLDNDDVITALALYAPVTLYDPDLPDSDVPADAVDVTRCPVAAALKLMMYGIIFEEANDLGAARSYISDALKVLDNQEQNQRGNARQSINVRPNGPGVRGIRSFR